MWINIFVEYSWVIDYRIVVSVYSCKYYSTFEFGNTWGNCPKVLRNSLRITGKASFFWRSCLWDLFRI